jgi:hypothetical protein
VRDGLEMGKGNQTVKSAFHSRIVLKRAILPSGQIDLWNKNRRTVVSLFDARCRRCAGQPNDSEPQVAMGAHDVNVSF